MKDYNPDKDPSRASVGIDTPKFRIDDWQIKLISESDKHGDKKPFQHVYAFVKNNQSMSRHDFETTLSSIRDILDEKGVNSGILMFMHGTYVFTEVPVDLNAVIVKLASGINFNGEVTGSMENLELVNSQLGR